MLAVVSVAAVVIYLSYSRIQANFIDLNSTRGGCANISDNKTCPMCYSCSPCPDGLVVRRRRDGDEPAQCCRCIADGASMVQIDRAHQVQFGRCAPIVDVVSRGSLRRKTARVRHANIKAAEPLHHRGGNRRTL